LKLSAQGKKEAAVAALQEAIRIFPNYFNAHFVLGNELIKTGKYSDAIAQLEEARGINPKDDRIYELFGIVLMRQGKYAVARPPVFCGGNSTKPARSSVSFDARHCSYRRRGF